MESAIDVDTARVRERMAALFIYKPPDVTLIQHLRDLAGAIHMQLAALSENAAAARQAVSTIRERSSLPFADSDAAEAALVAWIDAAELEKSTKLEAEAVAVDEALSEADTLYVAASSAAADHSTSRIDVARVAARLHRLQQRVTALPTAPVEPVVFNVVPGPFEPTSRSNVLGRVSAPRAVTPADVNVDGAPSFVVPGGTLRFSLKLADSYECEDDFDAAVAIDMLSAHARLSVSLLAAPTADGAGAPQQPEPIALAAALNADVEGRRLVISIPVPPNTLKDSTVALESLVIGAGSSASAASAVPDAPLLSVRVGANHDPAPPGPLTDATRRGDLAAVHELLAAGASTEEGIEVSGSKAQTTSLWGHPASLLHRRDTRRSLSWRLGSTRAPSHRLPLRPSAWLLSRRAPHCCCRAGTGGRFTHPSLRR